jgi:hypothetical protein
VRSGSLGVGAVDVRRGGREERGIRFAGDPERLGGGEAEEAGDVEILRAAGQEHRVAVIEQLAEAETLGLDGGLGDGSAGHGAGGGGDGAHLAEAGQRDLLYGRLGGVAFREQVARDGHHVVHTLGEERVVVAEGIGRDFAGAGDDAGLLELLVVLEE